MPATAVEIHRLVAEAAWMYGYGVMFLLDDRGEVVRWGHTGEEEGVSRRLHHYPRLDADVVILGNTSNSSGALAWHIHDSLVRDPSDRG